jgi:hypothetical protein
MRAVRIAQRRRGAGTVKGQAAEGLQRTSAIFHGGRASASTTTSPGRKVCLPTRRERPRAWRRERTAARSRPPSKKNRCLVVLGIYTWKLCGNWESGDKLNSNRITRTGPIASIVFLCYFHPNPCDLRTPIGSNREIDIVAFHPSFCMRMESNTEYNSWNSRTHDSSSRYAACSVRWWLMASAGLFWEKVLLAGCWWLICSERKVLLAGGW